jgi:uncharacterized protein (DUF2461 family)
VSIQELLAEIERDERALDAICHRPYVEWQHIDQAVMQKLDLVERLIEELDQ